MIRSGFLKIGSIALMVGAMPSCSGESPEQQTGPEGELVHPQLGVVMEGLGEIVNTCNDGTNQASSDNFEEGSKTMNLSLLGGSTVISVVNNAISVNGWPCYTNTDGSNPAVALTTANVRKLNITTHASIADKLVFDLLPGSFGSLFGSSGGATVTAKATDSIAVRGTNAANNMKVGESGTSVYLEVTGDTKADIKIGGTLPTTYTFVLGDGADSITGAGGDKINATHIDPTATALTPLAATRNLVVYGGSGKDTLQGGNGDDVLYGGDDDDTFLTAADDDGSDTYHGGAGVDTMSYAGRTDAVVADIAYSGVTITGTQNLLALTYPFNLTAAAITVEAQALTGVALTDAQALLDAVNASLGAFGTAWINSSNQLVVQAEDDEVTVVDGGALGLTTGYDETDADDGKAGENDDIRDDVENLVGGNGGDTLVGSRGSNVISGGPGDDTIYGGPGADDCSQDVDVLNGDAGNDRFIATFTSDCGDTFNGGVGTDSMDYQYRLADLTIKVNGTADDGEDEEADNVKNDIEVIIGGAGDDTIDGSNNAETIHGGPGGDTINGGGGDDILIGNSGNDTLNGDAGNDLFLAAGVTTVYDSVLYVDETDVGLGNDTMNGGAGSDKLTYAGRTAPLTVTLCTDAATSKGASALAEASCSDSDGDPALTEADNAVNIEWLVGGSDIDTLTGHTASETIEGGAGGDIIRGGAGDDTLFGDDGDDDLDGEAGNDLVNGGAGDDAISGGAGEADVCQTDAADVAPATACEVM